jgi:hypothetical protein
MNLYEINAAILDCVDTETGDILDLERLEALEIEHDAKISNLACWVKELRSEAAAIKAEKDALDKRMKAKENLADRISNYLENYLNGAKFEDSRCSISYRKSTSTQIADDLDLNTLPDEYKKITIAADTTAIKKALQSGEKIDGCMLVEKNNMQIR